MFHVAIFIALQPLSIFEFILLRLPYAPAMPTATESEQWKSALVAFAPSNTCVDAISVSGPLHGWRSTQVLIERWRPLQHRRTPKCPALPSAGTGEHHADRPKTDYALASGVSDPMGALQLAERMRWIDNYKGHHGEKPTWIVMPTQEPFRRPNLDPILNPET
jgi:hypothetical protein